MLHWFRRPPSLYEHIQRHLAPGRPGLLPGGYDLPDEAEVRPGSELRFAPGLADHLFAPEKPSEERLDDLLAAIRNASMQPGKKSCAHLERAIRTDDCLAQVDALRQCVAELGSLDLPSLRHVALQIFKSTGHRGALKYAIAFLGWCGNPADAPLLETVGRHEEFTLFAAVALTNVLNDPLEAWFRLAQQVSGWGKIDLVERICERLAAEDRPDIRAWLLRHGCQNEILTEYLGLTVAKGGRLVEALQRPEVDNELLAGAGTILTAMIDEEPAPGFADYPEGEEAVRLFLQHATRRPPDDLQRFLDITSLDGYLQSESCDWATRSDLQRLAGAILQVPEWRDLALAQVNSQDHHQAWLARRASRRLGLQVTNELMAQLERTPLESGLWYDLVDDCNETVMLAAIELARRLLPLPEIATGPATQLGVGPEFKPHHCLDVVLQAVHRFPGTGGDLLLIALRSPVTRNRNFALTVLADWPVAQIGSELWSAVEHCRQADPDEKVRLRAAELLTEWKKQGG